MSDSEFASVQTRLPSWARLSGPVGQKGATSGAPVHSVAGDHVGTVTSARMPRDGAQSRLDSRLPNRSPAIPLPSSRSRTQWKLLPLVGGLKAHQNGWSALNLRLHDGHPLTSFEFVYALARHFGQAQDRLAVCLQGRELVAAVPLSRQTMRWRSFRPSQTEMSPLLVSDQSQLQALLTSLPSLVLWLDLYSIDPLYSPDLSSFTSEVKHHATTLSVDLCGDFISFWQARSGNLRGSLKNKWNRLRKDGRLHTFRSLSTTHDVLAGLGRFAVLEGKGWKSSEGTAVTLGTVQGDFYTDILTRFAESGNASIYELLIDDEVAASEIVIRGGRMSVLLKIAHNEALRRYAPGFLLDQLVLEAEFAFGASDVVEFYTSANQAQLRWGTAQRDIQHLRLFPDAMSASLGRLWRTVNDWHVVVKSFRTLR